MDPATIAEGAAEVANSAARLSSQAADLAHQASRLVVDTGEAGHDPFVFGFTVFVLACFVGYYVVWNVTPALHSPLMGVTNAISSVIVVGGLLAVGLAEDTIARVFGFLAVLLASVNIFGGFLVTHRMLSMFRKKGS